MSLQLIAKEMEAKGRKGDSMLVHMTPGEVAGLQKLAESAGGSLSVNPDTGLVEANFLKQMLPTLVGAGVGFFTANPMLGAAAGAAVGGYQANRAGQDVGSGMLMGGLGGYGGASLGSSLQAAGAPATAGGAGSGAAAKTATNMATNAVMNQALGGFTPAQQQAAIDQGNMLSPMDRMAPVPPPVPTLPTTAGTGAGAPNVQVPINTSAPGDVPANAPTKFADMTYSQRLEQGLGGIKAFGTEEGRDKALKAMGGSEGVMRMLMMSGLPAMYGARTQVRHPYGLLSADINKRGFAAAEGGEVGFFSGGGTGQGNGLLRSMIDNRPFIIDPATGNVIRNPNLPPPATATFANMVGSDGGGGGIAPNPDFDTPEKQAAFNRDNPKFAAIAQFAQRNNPLASLQEYMDPGVTERLGIINAGLTPNQNFGVPGFDYSGDYDSFASERAAVDRARPGLVDGGLQDPQQRAEMAAEAAASQQRDDDSMDIGYEGRGTQTAEANAQAEATGSPGANTGADAVGRSESADNRAQGGLLGLAKGGMRSGGFVIPADVVSMVGEGNTDAGYKRIKSMVPSATAIKGKDGGQSDTVKTSIEGKQRARVAHGEMYIPPETVKRLGGAKKLYAMMDRVRQQATGSKKQIKPVSLKRAMA
jgi:hypothetical protein